MKAYKIAIILIFVQLSKHYFNGTLLVKKNLMTSQLVMFGLNLREMNGGSKNEHIGMLVSA